MYFSNAKIGDKVWDYVWGKGKISAIQTFAIQVSFDNNDMHFYKDGECSLIETQRLFYYDSRPIVITQDDLELPEAVVEYSLCARTVGATHYFEDRYGVKHESNYIVDFKDYTKEKYTRKVHRKEPVIYQYSVNGKTSKKAINVKPNPPEAGHKIEKLFKLRDINKRTGVPEILEKKIDEQLRKHKDKWIELLDKGTKGQTCIDDLEQEVDEQLGNKANISVEQFKDLLNRPNRIDGIDERLDKIELILRTYDLIL